MGRRIPSDNGRNATSLLASCFVIAGGVFVCVFIVVANNGEPWRPALVTVAGILGVAFLAWLLRDKSPDQVRDKHFYWIFRKKPSEPVLPNYKPRRRRSSRQNLGSRQPPTAEGVRELRDGTRNWVPSNHPRKRKR